jgi:hypothetical protein
MSNTDLFEDDDFLDGCELDFTIDPDDDETSELRALFPDGDPSLESEWRELFKNG